MHEAFKRESDLLKSGRTGLHSGSGGQSFWRPWLPVTSAQFCVSSPCEQNLKAPADQPRSDRFPH